MISGAGGSGRVAELVKLRSQPAAWFIRTVPGVSPPWAECGPTWL
jgi:hypothetical protein